MLLRCDGRAPITQIPGTDVRYPVLEYRLIDRGVVKFVDGFHDLFSATDEELAGMGLAIIGNITRCVQQKIVTPMADAEIALRLNGTTVVPVPWPGMPDDRPVPLDWTQLPFEAAMFADGAGHLRYRVDRLAVMRRIQATWVPHLKGLVVAKL